MSFEPEWPIVVPEVDMFRHQQLVMVLPARMVRWAKRVSGLNARETLYGFGNLLYLDQKDRI
jgi:hypothetical protein